MNVEKWLEVMEDTEEEKMIKELEYLGWENLYFSNDKKVKLTIKIKNIIKKIVKKSNFLEWEDYSISLKEVSKVDENTYTVFSFKKDNKEEIVIEWRYYHKDLKFFVYKRNELIFVAPNQKNLIDFFLEKNSEYTNYLKKVAKNHSENAFDLFHYKVISEKNYKVVR